MTGTAARQLIGIAIPTLRELRAATLACISAGPGGEADAVDALREAGFAGGAAVYEAFEQWLGESGASVSAPDLEIEDFGDRAAHYFRDAGWGWVAFDGSSEESVASISMDDCWEADAAAGQSSPSCHITTGMLASFFGKIAGYPVAVMEIECVSAHGETCRFLLGNPDVMTTKWEQIRSPEETMDGDEH
jgi:predicted hydrocarbon binding protein